VSTALGFSGRLRAFFRLQAGPEPPMGDPYDFSVVLGGPLYQLARRTHLAGDALELLRRRLVVITLLAWVPPLILAGLSGHAAGDAVAVPFLRDIGLHIRFLVALPLLIVAELVIHQRLRPVVRQFLERGLIAQESLPRFHAAAVSALRLRNSVAAEVVLLVLIYAVGITYLWPLYGTLEVATWYAIPADRGHRLTPAGRWFLYVSLPLFQFILFRWYFRMLIWMRFLWQVSRCRLSLVPTHPDRAGGLGFLSAVVTAFAPFLTAHGALLAGVIANQIFFKGATLVDFKVQLAVVGVFLLLLVLGPLLLFAPHLAAARRVGLREYGALAQDYVRKFDDKWLRGGAARDEALLGSADIQSLADLGNSYEIVRGMGAVLFKRDAVIQLAVMLLLPVAPLLLTMISLEELLKMLLQLLR
jgi:hypothetical protein